MKKKLLRLFAGLAIAGMLLAFPALTGTEQIAEAAWCEADYVEIQVLNSCGPTATMKCFLAINNECELNVYCYCVPNG